MKRKKVNLFKYVTNHQPNRGCSAVVIPIRVSITATTVVTRQAQTSSRPFHLQPRCQPPWLCLKKPIKNKQPKAVLIDTHPRSRRSEATFGAVLHLTSEQC